MNLNDYIITINQRYKLGNATEHTFRGDLQQLLESLVTDIRATNEPKRQSCGAPDYIITRGEIPVGFIEAKDIGDKDLEGKKKTGNLEQFDRYKTGLSNLIITDYIDFLFYRDGEFTTKVSIGKVENGSIVPIPENFEQFTQLFKNFTETISQSIKSPTRLAEMMAGKARLMADIIEKSLNEDDEFGNLSNLKKQMLSFQKILIHDIENKSFSDIYSQTIAYGMFAARYHDPSLPTFSREEAVKLIPKSNPFLRKLFKDIADEDLDYRLVWIVDELVNVFLASDVASIMKNFGADYDVLSSDKLSDAIDDARVKIFQHNKGDIGFNNPLPVEKKPDIYYKIKEIAKNHPQMSTSLKLYSEYCNIILEEQLKWK